VQAKEYLNQIRDLDKEITAKLEQCDQLRAMATRTTASLSSEWVSGSRQSNDKMADCVVKLVDLNKEIDRDIDRLVDLKREVIGKINKVKNPDYRLLLFHKYVNGATWEQVAKNMSSNKRIYSTQHIRGYMHSQALKSLKLN